MFKFYTRELVKLVEKELAFASVSFQEQLSLTVNNYYIMVSRNHRGPTVDLFMILSKD